MPCASKLPTHSPASFHLLCSCECRTLAAVDDSLIPEERPLCWGPRLAGLKDGDQTRESGVGTLGARSGFWVLWKDLSSPFRADRVSHVLHYSCFLVRMCSDNETLYLFHLTSFSRLTLCFIWALDSIIRYTREWWACFSLQTGGVRESQAITGEKAGNRWTGVGEKIRVGGAERGESYEMSWGDGWPQFKRGWVIEVWGRHEWKEAG